MFATVKSPSLNEPRYVSLPLPGYVHRFCADLEWTVVGVVRCPSMGGENNCLFILIDTPLEHQPTGLISLLPLSRRTKHTLLFLIATERRGPQYWPMRRMFHYRLPWAWCSAADIGWGEEDITTRAHVYSRLTINILPSAPPQKCAKRIRRPRAKIISSQKCTIPKVHI